VVGAAVVLLAPSWARAQTATNTLTVVDGSFTRKLPFRPDTQGPTWINQRDCIDDDEITLTVNADPPTGLSGVILEVWVGEGTDCTLDEERQGAVDPDCWLVYRATPRQSTQVTMKARDIVARNKPTDSPNGPGEGTLDDCFVRDVPVEPIEISLQFMMVNSNGDLNTNWTSDSYETMYDKTGPEAPTDVSAGIGENSVVVEWTEPFAQDIVGYRFYCDPPRGGATGSTSQASSHEGGLEGGAVEAGAEGGLEGGAAGDGGVSATDAGTDGSTINPRCPSTALVAGEVPNEANFCGAIGGETATEGAATGLANGTNYAVAVAAVDSVGNVGLLSTTVCGTPQILTDFFERYREAGGQGGGGFCSIGAEPADGLAAGLAALVVAGFVRRRRRR
jgi:MYXO-CTERM domain-containing protein